MSDLSRLLGDVYRNPAAPAPEEPSETDPTENGGVDDLEPAPRSEAPPWADEQVLDAAFADWVPNDEDASVGAAGIREVAAWSVPPATPLPTEPDHPVALVTWHRADDDILPTASLGRRLSFSRR